MEKRCWRYRVDGHFIPITAGSYFPEHILKMYFNHYMRSLCVLSMKCTAVDKIQGILGVEVSFQLLGGAAGNGVLHEGIRLRFDDLSGYFESCSHQKIARKIEAALSARGARQHPE